MSRSTKTFFAPETVALALAVGFLLVARAGFVGSPIYVIASGHSMEPALHTGDVVVLQRTSGYRTGDVIAYHVPRGGPGAGLIIIHRIVGGNLSHGFVTKGDNKNAPDPWRPSRSAIVGRERLLIPSIGLVVGYLRTPIGLAGLAGLLTLAIALSGPATRRSNPGRSAWRRLVGVSTRRSRWSAAGRRRSANGCAG